MTAIRSFPDAPMAYRDGPSVPQRLRAWGANLWRTLQRTGQRRAAFALYALFVALYRLLAGMLRAATERKPGGLPDVQAVRDLARRHQASDPGFAADLLAAADRHEVLHGPG